MGTRDAYVVINGSNPTAVELNTLAKGPIGWSDPVVTSSGVFTTTEVTLTDLTIDGVPLAGGRRILVLLNVNLQSTVAADVVRLRVKRDGAQAQGTDFHIPVANTLRNCLMIFTITPPAGTSQFTVTAQRIAGSGNCNLEASSNAYSELTLTDIGPAT